MKILYVGNAQGLNNSHKYYLTEQRLINGFTRLGHNIYVFNDRDQARYRGILRTQSLGKKKMNRALIQQCKNYEPELIVLSHCKNVTNETLEEIRNYLVDVRIVYTNVDPLSEPQNVRDVKQRIGISDRIFITTAGEQQKQFGDEFTKVHYFPNPVDKALDTKCAFMNENADIDLLFLGRELTKQHDHRRDLALYLCEKNTEKVLNCYIGGLGINDKTIYGAAYYSVLSRSKMGICLSKTNTHYLYSSDRMSHYLAAGILSFIPEGSDFEDVLGKKAFVSYSSNEELWDKALYYNKHADKLLEIAKRGYEKAHDVFCVDRICQYILETTFENPFSMDYPWPKHAGN